MKPLTFAQSQCLADAVRAWNKPAAFTRIIEACNYGPTTIARLKCMGLIRRVKQGQYIATDAGLDYRAVSK